MKRVISISLGTSKRDHKVEQQFGGQLFSIERIGTDGDKQKAIRLIRELDGKVDAFGLGGTDLYIYAGARRYTFRESAQIAAAAQLSPIVDGSGIKNTLERRVVRFLEAKRGMEFRGRKALLVCAVDRFGLAEALVDAGAETTFGDLLFGLGLPFPIRKLNTLARLAKLVAPVITRLPISLFYPTGDKQNEFQPRFGSYFREADIIAGDFHFIRRYMPLELDGKTIITNTVTKEDQELLKSRGVALLVTTTPEMGGRSFGTNILEAVLVATAGQRPENLTTEDYGRILDELGVEPRIETFCY
ncbi:MAG: quinate 5-dehydrogenase [Negativicutes bacterium]|nr:quinate 5-dehydrogenase [Negativicutes bacterium]